MKKAIFSIVVSLLCVSLFTSCSNEIEKPKAALSFQLQTGDELKSASDIDTADYSPWAALISIKDDQSNLIYELYNLPLIKFGNAYITYDLELEVGSYTLEDFIIVNKNNELIYLSPKYDSELESLVQNPLPYSFDIEVNRKNKITLEVVPAFLGTAEQFGYAIFSFTIITPRKSGLVVHFPFSGEVSNTGIAKDSFWCNEIVLVEDRFGNTESAASFNGENSRINLNDNNPVILTREFSIAAWVLMEGPGGGVDYKRNVIFQQRDDNASIDALSSIVLCCEDRSGLIEFFFIISDTINSGPVSLEYPAPEYGGWHHYAATFDQNKTMSLYLDGELVADTSIVLNGDFITSIDHVDIGVHTFFGGQIKGALNGSMDDFRIYDKALTHNQIYRLHNLDQ